MQLLIGDSRYGAGDGGGVGRIAPNEAKRPLQPRPMQFFSATGMVTTWLRRVVREWSSRVPESGKGRTGGRTGGRTASAKWARTRASSASVLASLPVALAKSRTCRGLTTATGRDAAANAAARGISRPPVAPGGFQHHHLRPQNLQLGGQFPHPSLAVSPAPRVAAGPDSHVQPVLGHIDPHVNPCFLHASP